MRYGADVPVWDAYDLVVCGGGPSGIPAALAARRAGLRVLLVEGQGQLGGTTTSAGVSHLLGGRTPDNRHQLVGGLFLEITEELARRGGAIDPRTIDWSARYQPHGWMKGSLGAGVPVDPNLYAALLDEKMLQAGVDVLFFTQFVEPVVADGRVTHVVLFNKSGLFAVPATAVVDATGDADVAARAGCAVTKGRPEDGLMTPATLIFHVDGVDQDVLEAGIYEQDSPRFRELIADLRARGEWTFPYDIFISVQLTRKGTMMINTTRITVGHHDLTGVEEAGRDGEPDLRPVEGDGERRAYGHARDLARRGVDARGEVHGDDGGTGGVHPLDQRRRLGPGLPGEAGAEEGIDDHVCALDRMRLDGVATGFAQDARCDPAVTAVRALAADDGEALGSREGGERLVRDCRAGALHQLRRRLRVPRIALLGGPHLRGRVERLREGALRHPRRRTRRTRAPASASSRGRSPPPRRAAPTRPPGRRAAPTASGALRSRCPSRQTRARPRIQAPSRPPPCRRNGRRSSRPDSAASRSTPAPRR